MASLPAILFGFILSYTIGSLTVVAAAPQKRTDDIDGNYSRGPTLAGTIILALIAFLIFLIILTLVIFAAKKYRKRRMLRRHDAGHTSQGTSAWARSPALRVNPHPWQILPSTTSLPTQNRLEGGPVMDPTRMASGLMVSQPTNLTGALMPP